MKEIGGFIELETNSGREYHDKALALNCGRNCLLYLIHVHNIRKIYLPRYICDCIPNICNACETDIIWYSINENFMPLVPDYLQNNEYLYLVNYYGQIENNTILRLSRQYPHLIVDNSQAFYQMPVDGIDTLYTARKFFGVPDGAYLYTTAKLRSPLKQESSAKRLLHLAGRYEQSGAAYFEEFRNNENIIDNLEMRGMSPLTHNMLRGIDYDAVEFSRTENFIALHTELSELNHLHCIPPKGAYMYPFLAPVNSGPLIRKKLLQSRIYIPTLWPNVVKDCPPNSLEHRFANDILPLPIDQRYGREDTEFVAKQLIQILNI